MAPRPDRRTPLTSLLLERIACDGPLTFAAFMEACLYHPEHGYYTRQVPERGARDYVTSPDVGPLFGRLLAWQLGEMWERLGRPARFDLVEAGAGHGGLAEQILAAAREPASGDPASGAQAPEFARALRVTLVEASPRLREQARAALERYAGQVRLTDRLPPEGVVGCLLSNELVDALPVHRVVQRAPGLREIYVAARGDSPDSGELARRGELAETEAPPSSPELARYLERYGAPLQEGQQAEVHLAALAWLEQAAAALERGFLVTIDYGYRARELYGPAHQRGTLLAYRNHRAHDDWLAWPGEQDLTAQVNFTALEERGRELGLAPLGYRPQTQFLLALARASGLAELSVPEASGPETPADEPARRAARLQFKQLIHPEGMGEAFKVLIQAKGVDATVLTGLKEI